MTSPLTEGQREETSRVNTLDGSNGRGAQSEAREELDRVLQALGVSADDKGSHFSRYRPEPVIQ
jgi:hypothetical protein